MAYDPNDPADKAILDKAVKDALAAQAEEHETEIERLNNKNKELIGKLKKARTGEADTGEVERLENDLSEVQGKLRKAESDLRATNRALETTTEERNTARNEANSARTLADNEFKANRLTTEFGALNVGEAFREDLTRSMSGDVTVKEVNGKREAFVGDKSLADHLKEWAENKGKHYVLAPNNSGGNAGGNGNANGGAKKIHEMTETERRDAALADPAGFKARVDAGEHLAPVKT